MNSRVIAAAVVVLIALAALAVACGGDGNGNGDEAGIRTRQGLGVAALAASASREAATTGGSQDSTGATVPGAPAADTGVSKGGGSSVAPDFYPYPTLQQSQDGITVQGFGSAAITADSAILEFYFGGKATGVEPAQRDSSVPGSSGSSSGGGTSAEPAPQLAVQAQQITEADLKPVVDAIVAAGVPAANVEVIVTPYYGDPSYGGSATVRATVSNVDSVGAVVKAATDAAAGLTDISMQGTNVSYTVSDCAALERAAMEAAVKDARERGTNFAGVLGVGLGDVAGASNYSSSLYGGSPCDSQFIGPVPLGGIAYAEGQTPDVQLMATVTITFSIQ
ncbi:MAG: SIMPL domain-containing protein [Dehalococcoidia bacterium]|nr:SIMPL domain-containing protein [Dehalococcoidia bacterium]